MTVKMQATSGFERQQSMNFNKLIPELSVSSLEISKNFYIGILGFKLEYERLADKLAFLSINGAQIMIEEINGNWSVGDLEKPFGRGVNFQIELEDPKSLYEKLKSNNIPLFRELTSSFYETPNGTDEQIEFLVQDPDGYLLRFCN